MSFTSKTTAGGKIKAGSFKGRSLFPSAYLTRRFAAARATNTYARRNVSAMHRRRAERTRATVRIVVSDSLGE